MEKLIETKNYEKIPITKNTLKKIQSYAKISGSNECYGFLISPLNVMDGVVYNAILAPDQKVSGGTAKIDGRAAAIAKVEIKNMGYKPIGFWHSHGSMAPWHSGTDDKNMDRRLLSFAANTEVQERTEAKEGYDIENNELIYRRENLELRVGLENGNFDFSVKPVNKEYFQKTQEDESDPLLVITKKLNLIINDQGKRLMTKNPCSIKIGECVGKTIKNTGIGYSIVTNHHGKIFAEIGTSKWCNVCERLETKVSEAKLDILTIENDLEFTIENLKTEFKTKVKGFGGFKLW